MQLSLLTRRLPVRTIRVSAVAIALLAVAGCVEPPRESLALERNPSQAGLFVDGGSRPTADAREALTLLAGAATEGLDPGDYDAVSLAARADMLAQGPADRASAADFDRALADAVARYLGHLHLGRVSPREAGFKLDDREDEHDFAVMLQEAVASHRLSEQAASLVPPLDLYRNLRASLAGYRTLAADPSLTDLPVPTSSVKPGDAYPGVAALARLLDALGDLPGATLQAVAAEPVYGDALAEGVVRFQSRHGLAPDGVLGRATIEALRTPLSQRVRQIELSLERLRWLPHVGAGPLIGVNIPMFQLWAWDDPLAVTTPNLQMGVIVGQALRTETPVFVELMESAVFRPYWNVPASIAVGEVLPAVRRQGDYLERNQMELVAGQGDRSPVVPTTPENIERLARGEIRLRQRPGPANALGLVKFVFPNDDNIYMHGTPAPELFDRSRRDFSHGCIRVEDPLALAEWVLRGTGMTREQMLGAMQGAAPRTVALSQPVQVVLFYMTAVVTPADGEVRFADDIYRSDVALDRALVEKQYVR